MTQRDDPHQHSYPTGRGYGHDYLRGGEVFGGYGYSARPGYQRRRGDDGDQTEITDDGRKVDSGTPSPRPRPHHQADKRSTEHPLSAS